MAASSKNILIFGLIGGGLVVAGTSAFLIKSRSGTASTLPSELQLAALKDKAEHDPAALRDTMHENMRREDLTDEQRRELRSNMREVWQSMMRERMDAWYAAESEAEKTAIIDQQINEFEARRAEWEKRRAEAEQSGESEQDRERFRQMFSPPSKEERKARSESRSADQTARMMTYFAAMRKRMEERGIQPPGGPGGRGPWGRR